MTPADFRAALEGLRREHDENNPYTVGAIQHNARLDRILDALPGVLDGVRAEAVVALKARLPAAEVARLNGLGPEEPTR